MLDELKQRSSALLKYLNQSPEELASHVNEINEISILSQVVDPAWLDELQLRVSFEEHSRALSDAVARVNEANSRITGMTANEESLVEDRKRYIAELASVRQSILKFKAKYEESSHHISVFSTGASLIKQQDGAEEMRCSFNELRRVNAALEERLVLTGVSKQKVMSDLKEELTEIRGSCSRNPTRYQPSTEDAMEDLNLSSHILKDINEIWKATLPRVNAQTGQRIHDELLTFLSSSLGYFCSDIVDDLADLTVNSIDTPDAHADERAKLLGTLSVETHRYRSISGALQSAVKDSGLLLDPSQFDSMGRVICESCQLVKQRLGCSAVLVWKLSHGSLIGYGDMNEKMVVANMDNPVSEPNTIHTFSVSDPGLPGDIAALVRAGFIKESSESLAFESLSVRFEDGGMTAIRSSQDIPFAQFSGIYCEQFHRRIVSAIAPMQQLQIRRIADQRPLDLVECMFELRSSAHSPNATIKLVNQHMQRLFRARDVAIYIPLDNTNHASIIKLTQNDTSDSDLASCLNTSTILSEFAYMATSGVSVVQLDPEVADLLKPALQLNISRDSADEQSHPETAIRTGSHLLPVIKGRLTVMIFEWWNADATVPNEGFEDPRIRLETFFDPESVSHKSTLKSYADVLEGILANWFKTANSTFSQLQEVNSYDVESLVEEKLIQSITSKHLASSRI